MNRTPAEVGKIVMMRRQSLGLSQEGVPGVSDSLIRQIEEGKAPERGRGGKRQRFMDALGWPADALARLAAGADPQSLVGPLPAPKGGDLRDLLGVGGQVVQDRLDKIEARLDRLEHGSNVVDLDTRRTSPKADPGYRVDTARAAGRHDGQADTTPPVTPDAGHRPTGPDVHPDDFNQDPGDG